MLGEGSNLALQCGSLLFQACNLFRMGSCGGVFLGAGLVQVGDELGDFLVFVLSLLCPRGFNGSVALVGLGGCFCPASTGQACRLLQPGGRCCGDLPADGLPFLGPFLQLSGGVGIAHPGGNPRRGFRVGAAQPTAFPACGVALVWPPHPAGRSGRCRRWVAG